MGVKVFVGVNVLVGVGVGVTYSASTERIYTCPSDALTDQVLQPAGTLRMKLLKPAAELLLFRKSSILVDEQALIVAIPPPAPTN